MSIRLRLVRAIYADHNSSRAVRRALEEILSHAATDAFILNIGAGHTRFDSRVRTLEIESAPGIDYVGSVTSVPLADSSVDLVITQEVLEHVDDPFLAMREIYRILKPEGKAYVQLPFMIGFHPCPNDYWRFTHQGIEQLAHQAGFAEASANISVGSATGAYRIAVEFFAILTSLPFPPAYRAAKGFFSLFFYPIKWLDGLLDGHPEAKRISGGFFVVLKRSIA